MPTPAAIKAATKHYVQSMPRRHTRRKWALDKIAAASSPMREATRLIGWFQSKGVFLGSDATTTRTTEQAVDLSTVEELRVKLRRKRGGVGFSASCPAGRMLDQLARDVVIGAVVRQEDFNARAAAIIGANDGFACRAHHEAQDAIIAAGKTDLTGSNRVLSKALRITDTDTTEDRPCP